jgi:hypothetical protein
LFTVRAAVFETPRYVAVNVTAVAAVTAFPVTVNVAVRAPAAIVTETGTDAAALFDDSVTTAPPAGAFAVNVTVPVTVLPAVTVAALSVNVLNAAAGGVTVNTVVFVTVPFLAVIVTAVDAVTALLVTVKVAAVAPAGTVTDTGTVAAVVAELVSVMTIPPAGAAAVSVTVPVTVPAPAIVAGETLTESNAAVVTTAGFTVRIAVWLEPPAEPVTTTVADVATALLVTLNVAVV